MAAPEVIEIVGETIVVEVLEGGATVVEVEVPGLPGKSAYRVAVDDGFVGTEAEWLASLQGEDGDTSAAAASAAAAAASAAAAAEDADEANARAEQALDLETLYWIGGGR